LSTGTPVPRALRAPVRALGIPVDSADLADARSAMATLRAALAQRDDTKVATAGDALLRRLDRLGRDDRAAVDTEARALLSAAAARLRVAGIDDAPGTASEPGTTGTPSPADDSGSGSSEQPAPTTTREPAAADPGSGTEPVESPVPPSTTEAERSTEIEPPSP
jgi:hypothetical protein